MDIQCIINAIALRQFGKALQLHRALKAFQSSVTAQGDDICKIALAQFKSCMVTFLQNHPMPDIQELELVSSTPLSIFLNLISDADRINYQMFSFARYYKDSSKMT